MHTLKIKIAIKIEGQMQLGKQTVFMFLQTILMRPKLWI